MEGKMAEPVRNNEPLSDTRWPETVDGANNPDAVPRIVSPPTLLPEDTPSRPIGEWPHSDITEAAAHERDTRLESAGEAVGTAIGVAINQAKDIPNRLQDGVSHLKRRFRVITGGGSAALKLRPSELADEAGDRASEFADEAKQQARRWETRARRYAHHYPFQFIASVAAAGFAVGFLLRLWRDE